jgi:hypothetical protein
MVCGMSEQEDAVVEMFLRVTPLWRKEWLDLAQMPGADDEQLQDMVKVIVEEALSNLRPGDCLPGGLVCVPAEPSDEIGLRLVESRFGYPHSYSHELSVGHITFCEAAKQDYRAMIRVVSEGQ